MINIRVPAGIGDISWIYSKLVNLDEKINWHISQDNPQRSMDFVNLLPMTEKAQYITENFHSIVNHCLPATITKEKLLNLTRTSIQNIACNRFLEKGNSLNSFIPELYTEYHYEINTSDQDKEFGLSLKKYGTNLIGIYTSNYHNNTIWGGWHIHEWKHFIQQLHNNMLNLTFIFLGATYDKELPEDITKLLSGINIINICGQTTIGQCIETIKNLKYFISYPSGLAVISNVINTPVMMFYPKHLEKLINTWPDPVTIKNKTYKGCTFPTPEQAVQWILYEYHIDEKLQE